MDDLRTRTDLPTFSFWFDSVEYHTREVTISVIDMKRIAGASLDYQAYEEAAHEPGKYVPDIPLSDGTAFDLRVKTPHIYAIPPATIYGGGR